MKIFVTVGTTPFNSLMKYIDENIKDHEIVYQISDGEYIPKNGKALKFVKEIESYYNWADIVITHAGAGSVYKLLEMEKKIIVVPNLERLDNHQEELADFVEKNNYAFKAMKINEIERLLEKIKDNNFSKYMKKSFFVVEEILKELVKV